MIVMDKILHRSCVAACEHYGQGFLIFIFHQHAGYQQVMPAGTLLKIGFYI